MSVSPLSITEESDPMPRVSPVRRVGGRESLLCNLLQRSMTTNSIDPSPTMTIDLLSLVPMMIHRMLRVLLESVVVFINRVLHLL